MRIDLKKAHQLISELESRLNAASSHTAAARQLVDDLVQGGEAKLRKKTAEALKVARKKADTFAKSLIRLEGQLADSISKLAEAIDGSKPASETEPAKATKPAAKTSKARQAKKAPRSHAPRVAGKVSNATAAAPKTPAKAAKVNRGARHSAARGRRQQARRDSMN